MWVKINSCANYPTKNALGQFEPGDLTDMMQDNTKFAVSWVSSCVAEVVLQLFVEAWNHNLIRLKGGPIDLKAQNSKTMCQLIS